MNKDAEMLVNSAMVAPGPAGSNTCVVSYSKKPKKPFFIKTDFSKICITCKDCRRFKSFCVCDHVLVVAHTNSVPVRYIEHYNKKEIKGLITKIVNSVRPQKQERKSQEHHQKEQVKRVIKYKN